MVSGRNIPPPRDADDDLGLIGKVAGGKLNKLNLADGLEAGQTVSSFVPIVGQPLSVGLGAISGGIEGQNRENDLARTYGDLQSLTPRSNAIRRTVANLRILWKERLAEGAVSAVGGIAGGAASAAALAAVVSGPPGWVLGSAVALGGAMAGGKLSNMAYNKINPRDLNDPTLLVAQISEAQKRRQEIPPEMTFAALAMNMSDDVEKRIVDRLETLTGSRSFHEALANGDAQALRMLMQEFDADLRAATHVVFDPANPMKTTSEQYAEMINSGQLDAKALIDNRIPLPMPSRTVVAAQSGYDDVVPPRTPVSHESFKGQAL